MALAAEPGGGGTLAEVLVEAAVELQQLIGALAAPLVEERLAHLVVVGKATIAEIAHKAILAQQIEHALVTLIALAQRAQDAGVHPAGHGHLAQHVGLARANPSQHLLDGEDQQLIAALAAGGAGHACDVAM